MMIEERRREASTFHAAIFFNNEGVRQFQEGRLREAGDFFDMSLDELAQLEKTGITLSIQPSQDSRVFESHPISGWSNPSELTRSHWCHDRLNLFSRLIVLREHIVAETEDDIAFCRTILTAAVIFNSALNQHIKLAYTTAEREPSSSIASVRHLYEASFRELQRVGLRVQRQPNWRQETSFFDLDVMMIALLNNMGVLYCNELAMFEDARRCLNAGSRLLLRCEPPLLEARMTPREMNEICMNVWMASYVSPAA